MPPILSKFTGGLVGHSFANNVNKNHDRSSSQSMTKFLGIDDHFSSFVVEGHGGAMVPNLLPMIDKVCRKKNIDVLVVDIMSNDLCQLECDVIKLAEKIVSLAKYARIGHDVKQVIILGVIPRLKCREVSADIFGQRKIQYNEYMKEKIKSQEGIKFTIPKGFWRNPDRSILPISKWSTDKIHPGPRNDHKGFGKYKKNIRHVLLSAAGKLYDDSKIVVKHFWLLFDLFVHFSIQFKK